MKQEFYEVYSSSNKLIGVAKTQKDALEMGKSFKEGAFSINFKMIDISTGKSCLPSDISQ